MREKQVGECLFYGSQRRLVRRWIAVIFGLSVYVVTGAQSAAQLPLDEGELVKVPYQGQWVDAVVIGQRGQNFGVRFSIDDKEQQAILPRRAIRKLCEVEALDFSRNWASKDGKFRVDAALHKIHDDSVDLQKLDGVSITVKLASLSDRDVAYVKTIAKNLDKVSGGGTIATKVPALPPLSKFTVPVAVELQRTNVAPFPLGETPSTFRGFEPAGIEFAIPQRHGIGAVVPVGGPDQLVMVGSGITDPLKIREPGQISWLSMARQKVTGVAYLPPNHVPLDYNPQVHLLLTMDLEGVDGDGGSHYAIWKVAPGGIELEPVKRWAAPHVATNMFAKVVSERVVVVRVIASAGGGDCIAWDIETGAVLYSFRTFAMSNSVRLSFDRRHLLSGGLNGVSILDAQTGAVVGFLDTGELIEYGSPKTATIDLFRLRCNSVDLSADGKQVVAASFDKMYVWNLEQAGLAPKSFDLSPFRESIKYYGEAPSARWLDHDHILLTYEKSIHGVSRMLLYRLSLGYSVWFYLNEPGFASLHHPRYTEYVDGKLIYVADPTPGNVNDRRFVGGVIELPGPRVSEATQNLQLTSLYAITPGSRVRIRGLNVSVPTYVRQQLLGVIEANGWIYDDEAQITFDLSMGDGVTQFASIEAVKSTINLQPYCPLFSSIQLWVGDQLAWRSLWYAGSPSDYEKWAMHNRLLDHARDANIPNKIVAPKYRFGIGYSTISAQGVQPKAELPVAPTADDENLNLREWAEELKNRQDIDPNGK